MQPRSKQLEMKHFKKLILNVLMQKKHKKKTPPSPKKKIYILQQKQKKAYLNVDMKLKRL